MSAKPNDSILSAVLSASALHSDLVEKAEKESDPDKKRALYRAATHIYKGVKKLSKNW